MRVGASGRERTQADGASGCEQTAQADASRREQMVRADASRQRKLILADGASGREKNRRCGGNADECERAAEAVVRRCEGVELKKEFGFPHLLSEYILRNAAARCSTATAIRHWGGRDAVRRGSAGAGYVLFDDL